MFRYLNVICSSVKLCTLSQPEDDHATVLDWLLQRIGAEQRAPDSSLKTS